jgi:hypothetical protein
MANDMTTAARHCAENCYAFDKPVLAKFLNLQAAEIERLHAWRDAKNEACEVLEKENERLRAALEPFANSTEIPDSIMSGEMGDEAIYRRHVQARRLPPRPSRGQHP